MTVLLHGFWGQPKDWNQVIGRLPLGHPVWAPDLYEPGALSPDKPLEKWTEHFLAQIRAEDEGPVQLVGYSMGARLALNALVKSPQTFSRALLLSGTPFLAAAAHGERQEWERDWSARFLQEDWAALEDAWQDQAVLQTSTRVERRRAHLLREMLGLSLTNWSPRLHPFDEAAIKALPASVDWAFGALDQKYANLAKTLQELPVQGQITVIPNAGHRLPADAADFICNWIVGG